MASPHDSAQWWKRHLDNMASTWPQSLYIRLAWCLGIDVTDTSTNHTKHRLTFIDFSLC
jgi:hypothetical protein